MIYTSYHKNYQTLVLAGLQPVNISVMFPRFVRGFYPSYGKLAPTYPMLKMSEEDYYKRFNKMLDALNPDEVIKEIASLTQGRLACLCCYEKDHNTCHRSRVAEWLRDAGYEVQEFGEEPEKKIKVHPQGELF